MIDLGSWGWFRFRGTWGFLRLWNRIELIRLRDKIQMEIVWHMPLWVINWAIVRAAVLVFKDDMTVEQITYKNMFEVTDPYRDRKKWTDDDGVPGE